MTGTEEESMGGVDDLGDGPSVRNSGRWVLASAAVVVGAGLVAGGYTLARSEAPPATIGATTTTLAEPSPPSALPAGFVPLHDGIGGRVERMVIRDDGTYVTLALVALVDANGDEQDPNTEWNYLWALELNDGRRIPATETSVSSGDWRRPIAFFESSDHGADDVVGVRFGGVERWAHEDSFEEGAQEIEVDLAEGPVRLLLDGFVTTLPDGTTISVSTLSLGVDGGVLEWSVRGGDVPKVLLRFDGWTHDDVWLFGWLQGSDTIQRLPTDSNAEASSELAFDAIHPASNAPTPLPQGELVVWVQMSYTWALHTPGDALLPIE